ncbi:phage tail protein [Herbivorax sp. ANBcel31]|uniref:phage tail protein n=1 Tax=Herbivorax sp. ANBcel31 TaxID=3069754 RepID=UPI0027B6BFC3|nr:phage tail protein [Herbivorax sp. ANBcel31]MDQ2085381.1 phage tail protein [Herbivorax sp. ANBcel31]
MIYFLEVFIIDIDLSAKNVARKARSLLLNRYPVSGNYFIVLFGKALFSFSKITGLESDIEYDTIVEGGVNSHCHVLPRAKASEKKIVFEKGIGLFDSKKILKAFQLGVASDTAGTILVMSSDLRCMRIITIDAPLLPVRWNASDLDSLSNDVMVESFEIVHCGLNPEIPSLAKGILVSSAVRLAKEGNQMLNDALFV